jgi:hypothetical protein
MDIEGKGFTEFFDSPQKVAGSKRAHTHLLSSMAIQKKK